jgi:toxin FitB
MAERSDETKGEVLRKWMNEHVLPTFEGRILSVDKQVALVSAKYHVLNPKPYRDILIAATAVSLSMVVVTRNTEDFCLDGVKCLTLGITTNNKKGRISQSLVLLNFDLFN